MKNIFWIILFTLLAASHSHADSIQALEGRLKKQTLENDKYSLIINEGSDSEISLNLITDLKLSDYENKNVSLKLSIQNCTDLSCNAKVIKVQKLILPTLKPHFTSLKQLLKK